MFHMKHLRISIITFVSCETIFNNVRAYVSRETKKEEVCIASSWVLFKYVFECVNEHVVVC